MTVQVTVNGAAASLQDGTTVAALVAERAEGQRRVAVARNGDVVPRSAWGATEIREGDAVEVLVATAGG